MGLLEGGSHVDPQNIKFEKNLSKGRVPARGPPNKVGREVLDRFHAIRLVEDTFRLRNKASGPEIVNFGV